MIRKLLAFSPTATGLDTPLRFWLTVSAWIAAIGFFATSACTSHFAWDAEVYWKVIESLRHGIDPYASCLVRQEALHRAHSINAPTVFGYIYSPMTLPPLRLLGVLPDWLLTVLFAIAMVAGVLAVLWVGSRLATKDERPWLALMLPFVIFFPGLLYHDVILSANVAYILYGLIFAAAYLGWTQGKWHWYYVAVLVASFCKPPLLTLLAFPVLVGKRQWFPAGITGVTGVALFCIQGRLWPQLFSEYMRSVQLEFDYNHEFGFGPAGVLGQALWDSKLPYSTPSTIFYLAFAITLSLILLFLSHRVRQGKLSPENWIPVALMGTILLNPRVKEYDLAAVTVPMLLIVWRMMRLAVNSHLRARVDDEAHLRELWTHLPNPALLLAGTGWFVALNMIATKVDWKPTALGLMLAVLTLGVGLLYCTSRKDLPIANPPSFHPGRKEAPEAEALSPLALR